MDIKQIKQIIDLMKRSELSEFAIEDEGFKLKIRRGAATGLPVVTQPLGSSTPFVLAAPEPAKSAPVAPVANPSPIASAQDDTDIVYVRSPMVGTFYRAASPDSKVFVEDHAKIVENSVVCIIEAMKIMNEIQAEVKGTIVEALVENGQPVEYGQRLFKVKQG